jgi:hypothetical protein
MQGLANDDWRQAVHESCDRGKEEANGNARRKRRRVLFAFAACL